MNNKELDQTIAFNRKQIAETHLSEKVERYRLKCMDYQTRVNLIVDKLLELYQYQRDNNEIPMVISYPDEEGNKLETHDAITQFIEVMEKTGYQCKYDLEYDNPWNRNDTTCHHEIVLCKVDKMSDIHRTFRYLLLRPQSY
jgi:hypothetical protein